ncbi:MAG: ABC transporter ATP-binding protein [Oscillospiraceae bacterium]|nr:ABC transporter ATP-binding protein [Oscillospiraceae bacterium]
MEEILSVKDLCKTYIVRSNSNNVLCNINLSVRKGEFVSVMGPSGSGKSTLLYTVSGMDSPTSGEVVFAGQNLSGLNRRELTQLRLREMGFIFQQMYMMKRLSVLDNILLPGYQANSDRRAVLERAESLMRRLGIIETASHEITEVSGGELQRACLCRALINSPKIIFADEPTGALNSRAAEDVMRELIAANRAGTAVMMVTHSERVAGKSDRVLYLMDGDIRGELVLGRMTDETESNARERKLRTWLEERGW